MEHEKGGTDRGASCTSEIMKSVVLLLIAIWLAGAACERAPEAAPAETPAAQDQIPEPAPAPIVPPPDTVAPSTTGGVSTSPPSRPPGAGATPPNATSPSEPSPTQSEDGAAVLQRASAAYAALRSMKADFVMQLNNQLLRQQTTSRGTLYQRRPDRIALRFSDPAGDMIIGDGEYFWIYTPSLDSLQVIQSPASASGDQAVDLQAQFLGDPVRRFRHTLHGQESVAGRAAYVLTLEPRERAEYKTLKVWLDTRDALARRFEITEHNGTVRRFDLNNFEANPNIPDATFRFIPPRGARIVRAG